MIIMLHRYIHSYSLYTHGSKLFHGYSSLLQSQCLTFMRKRAICLSPKQRTFCSVANTRTTVNVNIEETSPLVQNSFINSGKIQKNFLYAVTGTFEEAVNPRSLAEEHNLSIKLVTRACKTMVTDLLQRPTLRLDIRDGLLSLMRYYGQYGYVQPDGVVDILMPHFRRVLRDISEDVVLLERFSDMSRPAEWYPAARAMRRKIIFHAGPTNSGKTYAAMKSYRESPSGVYCGPLRLLACEAFNTTNEKGVPCDLITGEERRRALEASSGPAAHVSCTVEMLDLNIAYDVAVIDEIQMIGDESRGWAWTRAFLGVRAKEIHMCGEERTIGVIKQLCYSTREDLEIRRYSRLTPSYMEHESLKNDYSKVRKGDCVVAFSRRNIFEVKARIEAATKLKCGVIYGNLPSVTRQAQARLFNDLKSAVDVLVASDAIGMGLNLNIRRIIFSKIEKFNGQDTELLAAPAARQIAGRSGRFGTAYETGYITTLLEQDLEPLETLLAEPTQEIPMAGLTPPTEQLEVFHRKMPDLKISQLLDKFERISRLDGAYFMCDSTDKKIVADLMEHVPLSLKDRFTFMVAPVKTDNERVMHAALRFATLYSRNQRISLSIPTPEMPRSQEELMTLESTYRILDLYLWLSYRFERNFHERDIVAAKQATIADSIQKGLAMMSAARAERWGKRKGKYRMSN